MGTISSVASNWQQPIWDDETVLTEVRGTLRTLPPLVSYEEIDQLYKKLERVWSRSAIVFQAGDCAERISESNPLHISPKLNFLHQMSHQLSELLEMPVVTVGRIAGQYAKPRSQQNETCANVVMPVWRGDCVNKWESTLEARRNDPERMLLSYHASANTLSELYRYLRAANYTGESIWTSHEALLLDYEYAQVRPSPQGKKYLASTHWPWIGIRTLDLNGPHIALLSQITNPVACKIDSTITPAFITALCRRLNPDCIPGRLTLIARFGRQNIHKLGRLVDAVADADIPVLWLCDPMHGNTVKTPLGNKRRDLANMMDEMTSFQQQVTERNAYCAGMHLETTPEAVAECFGAGYSPQEYELERVICDPRLNVSQTLTLLSHWRRNHDL